MGVGVIVVVVMGDVMSLYSVVGGFKVIVGEGLVSVEVYVLMMEIFVD